MSNPTTPDSDKSDKELDSIIDTCLHPERNGLLAKERVVEGANYEHVVKRELKAALAALMARREAEAREEQIMQDFLSLIIDLPENFTENDLIEWRLDRLAALSKEYVVSVTLQMKEIGESEMQAPLCSICHGNHSKAPCPSK